MAVIIIVIISPVVLPGPRVKIVGTKLRKTAAIGGVERAVRAGVFIVPLT